MELIYSPSYQSFNLIFYFKYIKKKEILVISNNQDLLKICKKLGIKYIEFFDKKIKWKSIFHKKKSIESFYKKNFHEDDNLWIMHNNHDTLGYVLALHHSSKNLNVYFLDFDPPFHRVNILYIFYIFFLKPKTTSYKIYDYLTLKFVLKLSISFGRIYINGNLTFVLDENNRIDNKFLKSNLNVDAIRKKILFSNEIKYFDKKNLTVYFGNTIPFHNNYIENASFDETINELSQKIENLFYKPHPNKYNYLPKGFAKDKLIDNQLPFALLNNSCKIVISISSAVLVDVLENKKIKSISLIEIIKWKNINFKEEMYKYLRDLMKKRNLDGIYFPKNIKELLEIIND